MKIVKKILFVLGTPMRVGIASLFWFVATCGGDDPAIDWHAVWFVSLEKGLR